MPLKQKLLITTITLKSLVLAMTRPRMIAWMAITLVASGWVPLHLVELPEFTALAGVNSSLGSIRIAAMVGIVAGTTIRSRKALLEFARHFPLWAIFLLWMAFSILWSSTPLEGTRYVLKLSYPVMVLFVMWFVREGAIPEGRLIQAMIYGAYSLLIVNVYLLLFIPSSSVPWAGFVRFLGSAGNWTMAAMEFGVMALILATAFVLRSRFIDALFFLVAVILIVLTLSRAAWLSLSGGIFVIWFFVLKREVTEGTKVKNLITGKRSLAMLIITTFLLVTPLAYRPFIDRLFGSDRAASSPSPTSIAGPPAEAPPQESANIPAPTYSTGRELWWNVLITEFIKHPVAGAGAGEAPRILAQRLQEMGAVKYSDPGGGHNDYLRILVEGGIIGLGLFIGAVLHSARSLLGSPASRAGDQFRVPKILASATAIFLLTGSLFHPVLELYNSISVIPFVFLAAASIRSFTRHNSPITMDG